jgi:hypothetical protein
MVIVSGEAAAQISTIRPYPINREVNTLLVPIIGTNSIATTNGNLWKKLHHILGPHLCHVILNRCWLLWLMKR